MLAFARERAAQAGIANLDLRVADAQTLAGVPERAFDAALCRWGLMFLDRPRQALAAIGRRLVPGGCFVAALWAEPERVSWWTLPREVLARHVAVPAIDPAQPGVFHYAQAQRLHDDLASAGFLVEHEEEISTPVMESATPAGLVAWCDAFGLGRLLEAHPASVRAAWERDMSAAAAACRDGDGFYRLGGVTRLTVARSRAA
jgi:SAM-dependent methyltransferase